MNIHEQMQIITAELISEYGIGYRVSTCELKTLVSARFGTNEGSVIPTDYCYNRVNKGIRFLERTPLFAYVGRGVYECLGENYRFNGPVYTHAKGEKSEIIVGDWKDGFFTSNSNWELHFLK